MSFLYFSGFCLPRSAVITRSRYFARYWPSLYSLRKYARNQDWA
jgi:hypothetical protein